MGTRARTKTRWGRRKPSKAISFQPTCRRWLTNYLAHKTSTQLWRRSGAAEGWIPASTCGHWRRELVALLVSEGWPGNWRCLLTFINNSGPRKSCASLSQTPPWSAKKCWKIVENQRQKSRRDAQREEESTRHCLQMFCRKGEENRRELQRQLSQPATTFSYINNDFDGPDVVLFFPISQLPPIPVVLSPLFAGLWWRL